MLDVYLNKHLIGQLSCGRSGWAFRYDPRWQTASHGFDLTPTLQRTAGDIADTAKAQPVRNFFEYLLPEPAREAPKAAAAALDHLAVHAPNLDGPLTLVPSGHKPTNGHADGLTERDLVLQFKESVGRANPPIPLHVAEPVARYGASPEDEAIRLPFLSSNGLPVSMWLGRFAAPANTAQSSHFVRLDLGENARLPYATINHCWATLLARSIGLETPFLGLRQFPETAAVVQRLDRTLRCKSDDTALIQARYVVSAVQLLGLSPKYRFLPITVEQVAECARLCADTTTTTASLFRWMVFCLLIGGRNASAGTLHFHAGPDGIRLAAHDHLFCAAVYANEWDADALSSLDDERAPDVQARYDAIDQDALLALADHLGYDAAQARREVLRLISMLAPQSSFVATHLSQALGHSPTRAAEIDFLARIHRHVSETARRLGGKSAEV
ncbi:HipA domain-containing protein [Ralstonia solanacearum]|uniref:HipA domain-containing protein n=1 Tax=Ralstonia solanacearum TaxID=305 RepID=UPI000F608A1C|nr:HipA domain-containing protein [Ralstonia solanacearum]MCL9844789.1 HipA domain-containing protein [Ralstonia solanacearum]MDC6252990.1 HipA domain-containing protein [Ralstonia solanacearum]MDC6257572.1 HipA domain-containing protein [Ralstonia solanacearum]MDC6301772.1 HipA domain-containing protein [Ralstonia solanacearum]